MRSTQLLAPVYLLAAVSSAWKPLEAVRREIAPLLPRQDAASTSKPFDLSFSATQGDTAGLSSTETDAPSSSDSNNSSGDSSATTTNSDASSTGTGGSQTQTGKSGSSTGGSTGSNKSTKSASVTQFDPRLPAGGVQMVTPAAQATSYYKIKDYVTFAWNYTSLSVTPSAVDVVASCALNSATYTIASNMSITGPTQEVIWDTGDYQATAATSLLTGTYTLIIHDAAKDISATPSSGYLGAFNQFTFGMYLPQAYTPLSEYVCATCNAGVSSLERQTYVGILGVGCLTVLSFGWFAGVAGLW